MSKRKARLEKKPIFEIYSKNKAQDDALKIIQENSVVFLLGSPGTGKSFLSIAYSLKQLLLGNIAKILISRPAITSFENLGYIPGTLSEKLYPFMENFFEIIESLIGREELEKLLSEGKIEPVQLAYARGKTFGNINKNGRGSGVIVIVDEAQNCGNQQLKMILTRCSVNSKIILCGDENQSDLRNPRLNEIAEKLSKIESIGSFMFRKEDIVRSPLIGKILDVFDELN